MAKKFFYNRVYNTKKLITNIVIIAICIIGIILCFVFTSHFQGKNNNVGQLDLKKETVVEINQNFDNSVFFTKIENTDLSKVYVNYPNDYNIGNPGRYNVQINIDGTFYDVILVVVDTEKPELELSSKTILENDSYNPNDFVTSCKDNSNKNCIIDFYKEGVNEEGERIEYSNYKNEGIYPIKIIASDESGNFIVKETTLIINKKNNTTPVEINPSPTCKYGNDIYDNENYVMAVRVATNGCAVSMDLWKDAGKTELDQITNTEITKIKKELKFVDGELAITRRIIAIPNNNADGIVGYELRIIVTVTNDETVETLLDYKINESGNRVYTSSGEL